MMRRSPMPQRKEPLQRGGGLHRTPLAPVSRKRAREQRQYSKQRAAFLTARPRCEFPGGCISAATEVHHRAGRVGALYLDETRWSPLCHDHHAFLTAHPAIAYEMGMSERRTGRQS